MPSRGAEERQLGWIPMGREAESGVVGSGAFSDRQSAISKPKEQLARGFTAKDAKGTREEGISSYLFAFAIFVSVAGGISSTILT